MMNVKLQTCAESPPQFVAKCIRMLQTAQYTSKFFWRQHSPRHPHTDTGGSVPRSQVREGIERSRGKEGRKASSGRREKGREEKGCVDAPEKHSGCRLLCTKLTNSNSRLS